MSIKCANTFTKPPSCKHNAMGAVQLTCIVEDGGEMAGTMSQARATFCQDCALAMLRAVMAAASAQGSGAR